MTPIRRFSVTSDRVFQGVVRGLAGVALLVCGGFTGVAQAEPEWKEPVPDDAGCKQPVFCSKANQNFLRRAAGRDGDLSPTGGYPRGEDVIDVLHYELRFNRIDFNDHAVEAEAILTIRAIERLDSEVVLHWPDNASLPPRERQPLCSRSPNLSIAPHAMRVKLARNGT